MKKFSRLLLGLVSCLSLASCGKPTDSGTTSVGGTQGKINVYFWTTTGAQLEEQIESYATSGFVSFSSDIIFPSYGCWLKRDIIFHHGFNIRAGSVSLGCSSVRAGPCNVGFQYLNAASGYLHGFAGLARRFIGIFAAGQAAFHINRRAFFTSSFHSLLVLSRYLRFTAISKRQTA